MKKISCLLLAMLMLLSFAACGEKDNGGNTAAPSAGQTAAPNDGNEADNTAEPTDDNAASGGKLIYATSADYPPFEFIYVDDQGKQQYAGIDVFLAQKIADDMGKELQVMNMSFDSLMAALQKGDADIVIAGVEDTEERRVAADFSDPYYTDYPPMILVKAANVDSYKSVEDFSGKSVGAQTGTTKADIVTEQLPEAKLVALTVVTDLVNELVYDKCDAIVLDGAVAMQYAASNPDLAISEVSLGEAEPYCVAVQKGDPSGLLESINATIAAAKEDGTVEAWVEQANTLADQSAEG